MTEHDPTPDTADEADTAEEEPARIVIDPDDLSLDEVEEVETILGAPIDTLFSSGKPRATALKAVLLVIKRRDDPTATLKSVGSIKLRELTLLGE